VYATQKANAARSTFITGMSVSADGRTAYFAETTTDLSGTPHRCSMRLMAADQSGQSRQIADGDNPTIAPDSQRLAFQSAKDASCQSTRLHVLNLATSERRDFDVADFTRLLPRPPDRPAYVQFVGAHWSPDSRWLAVVVGVPEGWAATAIVDTRDWRLQLTVPDVWLEQIATSVLGQSDDFTTRQVAVVAWTADGTLALRVGCSACGPYLYASGTPGSEVVVAQEPTLAGATQPASDRWLGSFENWVLVADSTGIIARTDSKNVGLVEVDGYAANAAWPSGARLLPRVR
jgi:WD40-like Beta Propeller Repeat